MKRIKSSKGYGALEYTLLIAIVVIIALFFFLSIKNKDSTSAMQKGIDAVNDFIGSSPGGGSGGGSSNIEVEFPGGTKPTFEVKEGDDLDEDQVKGYLTDNNIIIKDKDGNIVDFSIENVDIKIDEPTYIQFDVVYEGSKETVLVPGSVNGLSDGCVLASDSDFDGDEDGQFEYIGSATCVKIPNVIKEANITSYEYMFEGSNVNKVISNNKNITNMEGIFDSTTSDLLDLRWLDTSNVTSMSGMFYDVDIQVVKFGGRFNTSKVEDMGRMFYMAKIDSVNFLSFDTSSVTNMGEMFYMMKTTYLDLSSFNTLNVTDMRWMLSSLDGTKVIDLRNMVIGDEVDLSRILMGYDIKTESKVIIVKDDETRKLLDDSDARDSFTNVLTIEEYYSFPSLTDGLTQQQINNGCILANHHHIAGSKNGEFTYVGPDEYSCIKIPNQVKGVEINSYRYLFMQSKVSKVIPNDNNILDLSGMFNYIETEELDITPLLGKISEATNIRWMFSWVSANNIIGIDEMNTSNVTDMNGLFYYSKIPTLDLTSFDTSKVTDMSNMFEGSQATQIKGLEGFNTSEVTDIRSMFSNSKATSLNLSSFDTSKVTYMDYMFGNAEASEIIFSDKFKTDNVLNMRIMFLGTKVNSLDLSSFNTFNANISSMFKGTNAKTIYVRNTSERDRLDNFIRTERPAGINWIVK